MTRSTIENVSLLRGMGLDVTSDSSSKITVLDCWFVSFRRKLMPDAVYNAVKTYQGPYVHMNSKKDRFATATDKEGKYIFYVSFLFKSHMDMFLEKIMPIVEEQHGNSAWDDWKEDEKYMTRKCHQLYFFNNRANRPIDRMLKFMEVEKEEEGGLVAIGSLI